MNTTLHHRIRPFAALAAMLTLSAACTGAPPTNTTPGTPVTSNGGHYTVMLASGTVLQRGVNDVMVHVHMTDGMPATLVSFRASMPAHGHEAFPTSIESDGEGMFMVHGLTLSMAGEWQLDLGLSHEGTTADDTATMWAQIE